MGSTTAIVSRRRRESVVEKYSQILEETIDDMFLEGFLGRPRLRFEGPSTSSFSSFDDLVCDMMPSDFVRRNLDSAVERCPIADSEDKRVLQNLLERHSEFRRELERGIATGAETRRRARRDRENLAREYAQTLEPVVWQMISEACPGCRRNLPWTIPSDHPVCYQNLTESISCFLDPAVQSLQNTRTSAPTSTTPTPPTNDPGFRELVEKAIYNAIMYIPQ